MERRQHRKHLDLLASFPKDRYPEIRDNQRNALDLIQKRNESLTFELPTGSGKTAVGMTFLEWLRQQGKGPLFYIVPTKTLVDQVKEMHPEVSVVYGRNEHPCLYYPDRDLSADDIPCSMLKDCAHRVNQDTGETHEAGAVPCPYLLQKYQAKANKKIVVATTAFYLFTQFFNKEWGEVAGLVIDEAHQIARTIRHCLSFEITDYHLKRMVALLERIDKTAAEKLGKFLAAMIKICQFKRSNTPTLLTTDEISELIKELMDIDADALRNKVGQAVQTRQIDPVEELEVLKRLEIVIRDLNRCLRSLSYAREDEKRRALNYVFAYYERGVDQGKYVQYRLYIKAYYVGLIVQRLLSPFTIAYSATIGNPQIFGYETGITFPFFTFPSSFSAKKARIYLPTDTPNLAVKARKKGEPARVLRRIAKACRRFADSGHRSLVVVVSEKERERFIAVCRQEKVTAINYGNGKAAKDAASTFKNGEGDILVGTVSNYGEGIDLPKQIAPVIFFLRPAYPIPGMPETEFEERRFGSRLCWQLRNWREMIRALQVRGRNLRSDEDLGVTFFISQQFGRFLYPSLPDWLTESYRGDMRFEDCINNALQLLAI